MSPGQGAQQPFSIVISTAQATIKADSRVKVDATLTNTSDANIILDVPGRPSYDMDVRGSNGAKASETERMRKIHEPDEPGFSGSFVVQKIAPGQSVQHHLPVNEFYDMSKPGKYTIQFQGTDRLTKVSVKSNAITVTVTP